MPLRDISVLLHAGTPEWPGDTPFACRWTWERARGASVNVSAISGSPHVGTHADAPLHVEDDGDGADQLPLAAFIGRCHVSDVRASGSELSLADLALPAGATVERLLLRTGASIADAPFPATWPVLSLSAVGVLLARGLRLLGVDAPSVDARESQELAVHRRLFAGGACIVENLDLREVGAGAYDLLALPLRLRGLDAAPVRAVLRDLTEAP
jgi:arylformamidase